MTNTKQAGHIQDNPRFHELVRKRDGLAWTLSACVLVLYFGFVLMVALAPDILTHPISDTSVIPYGIPIGIGVILGSIVLTAIYVYEANSKFDPIIEEIMRDAHK